MIKKVVQYLAFSALGIFLASVSYANSKQSPLNSTYQTIYTHLEQKVRIPIRLPLKTTIKKYLDDIYLNAGLINKDSYQFYFDLTADCNGSSPCSGGSMYAAKIGPNMPHNDAVTYPKISSKTHDKIQLAHGVIGYLEKDHTTGVGSSMFRTLTFDVENVRYQLTLKALPNKDFIALANSMLTNSEA